MPTTIFGDASLSSTYGRNVVYDKDIEMVDDDELKSTTYPLDNVCKRTRKTQSYSSHVCGTIISVQIS